jgi:hypothetical protein
MLLILGSENLLLLVIDAFVLFAPSPFSCLRSGRRGIDRLNLLVTEWLLPVFSLLVFEAFEDSLDPPAADLIGNLWKGKDDRGSESLNLDPLCTVGKIFV